MVGRAGNDGSSGARKSDGRACYVELSFELPVGIDAKTKSCPLPIHGVALTTGVHEHAKGAQASQPYSGFSGEHSKTIQLRAHPTIAEIEKHVISVAAVQGVRASRAG